MVSVVLDNYGRYNLNSEAEVLHGDPSSTGAVARIPSWRRLVNEQGEVNISP